MPSRSKNGPSSPSKRGSPQNYSALSRDEVEPTDYQIIDEMLQNLPLPDEVSSWYIRPSNVRNKKYAAVITTENGKTKTVNFGYSGMSDYTIHGDEQRRKKFVNRFRKLINDHYDNPFSPMFYSYHLLWKNPEVDDL